MTACSSFGSCLIVDGFIQILLNFFAEQRSTCFTEVGITASCILPVYRLVFRLSDSVPPCICRIKHLRYASSTHLDLPCISHSDEKNRTIVFSYYRKCEKWIVHSLWIPKFPRNLMYTVFVPYFLSYDAAYKPWNQLLVISLQTSISLKLVLAVLTLVKNDSKSMDSTGGRHSGSYVLSSIKTGSIPTQEIFSK